MPELIVYLLKVNIALVLFYVSYRFALRRLTFYTLNRVFLVCGIVFSSLYPFVNFSDLLKKHDEINQKIFVVVPDWNQVQHTVAATVPSFNYWQLLITIFWTGVVLMAVRLIIRLASLYRMHKNSVPHSYNDLSYRKISGDVNPFSFWQNIYLNPAQHKQDDLQAILEHEQVHVKEWHTLDVLLAEINCVFYWFNPGVWLMKQAVKENLEFITDRRVLQSGIDSKSYQYSLLTISYLPQTHSLVNNFNLPDIKKRIMMMNKKNSSKKQISRYLLLLPMVIVLSLIFTVSKAELEKKNFGVFANMELAKNIVSVSQSFSTVVTKKITEISASRKADEVQLTASGFVRFSTELKTDTPKIRPAIKADRSIINALFVIDGVPSTSTDPLSQLKGEDIASMHMVNTGTVPAEFEKYADKAVNGIVYIITKSAKAANDLNVIKYTGRTDQSNDARVVVRGLPASRISSPPLYIINGTPASIDGNQILSLVPDNIETISVLKSPGATAIYGPRAETGVILIKTKDSTPVFPKEFSPNDDGIDDKLVITNISAWENVTLRVFNRFGQLQYEQAYYKNDWNGKNDKGTLIPRDTYFATLTVEKDKRVFTGSFLLDR